MRAIAIEEFGGRDKLKEMDLPAPRVGPDFVLIRVRAAGLNPVDWKLREGGLEPAFRTSSRSFPDGTPRARSSTPGPR